MGEPTIQFTAAKGTKYVRIKTVLTRHAVSGAPIAMYWRADGKIGKDNAITDRGKVQSAGTHDEARARLAAEAAQLVAEGHTLALLRGMLQPASVDFLLAAGGSLAAIPIDETEAPIFSLPRHPAGAITPDEDRALAMLADAVGLDARSPKTGDTMLHVAVRAGSVALATRALTAAVDPDAANSAGKSARQLAEHVGAPAEAVLALFGVGASDAPLAARDLVLAAKRSDLAKVRACLDAGVPADAVDGLSAIVQAARALDPRKADVLAALVRAGAKADHAVIESALRGDPALAIPAIEALVHAGARPDASHYLDDTEFDAETRRALARVLGEVGAPTAPVSLAVAISMSDPEAVAAALARGESANGVFDRSTYSLLHHAAIDGMLEQRVSIPARVSIVRALLAAGAATDVPRVAFDTGEQNQATAYFPTLYALGGAPADQAAKKLLKQPIDASRKAELEAIVAAIGAARPPKPKAPRKAKPT